MLHNLKTVFRRAKYLTFALMLSGTAHTQAAADYPNILTIGDSMMVWNLRNSIPSRLDRMTNAEVVNRARIGARVLGGNIESQFFQSDWDIVVVNGGGNDLLFGCGCLRCDRTIERLISSDLQSGAFVDLLTTIRQTVPKVFYVGYLRSPGVNSAIEHCADEGTELEERIRQFMDKHEGMHFVSLVGLVREGETVFHSFDMIHPSSYGSHAISMMLLGAIIAAY